MTSVTPRWPVARRFRRRMPAGDNSVMSMWARAGARSQASTRWATRTSLPRLAPRGRRLPGRADAATGLRIVDAVVIHPAEHQEECRLHLLDLLRRQILEHAQRRLDRIGDHRDRGFHRPGLGTRIREILGIPCLPAVDLLRLIEEVG